MLRKRSRPVTGNTTSKQPTPPTSDPPPLADNNSSKPTTATLPLLHTIIDIPNPKPLMSPSSVLDTKPFFSPIPTTTPLWLDTRRIFPNSFFKTNNKHTHAWAQPGIGIALVDEDTTAKQQPSQKPNLVVFGSNLRVQIPSPTQPASSYSSSSHQLPPNSPNSPVEFGIKTPRSNIFGSLGRNNGVEEDGSHTATVSSGIGKLKGSISMEEMEQSEDYTCVISHGPVPKTTHIFGNCIVESCCGSSRNIGTNNSSIVGASTELEKLKPRGGFDLRGKSSSLSCSFELDPAGFGTTTGGDFLSFCHHCNKRIGHGRDIFMYRGEKAFCSQECRGEGMLFDGVEL